MIRRVVLCEGPEDLVALREIARALFRASPRRAAMRGAGGGERAQELESGRALVKMKVAGAGKTTLIRDLAAELASLEPRAPGDERLSRIACVFDPDGDPRDVFEKELQVALESLQPRWFTLRIPSSRRWLVAREDRYRVVVHSIAWRGSTPNVIALPDHQNLERLLVDIARETYPTRATLVQRWLGEMQAQTARHPWKAALHLWCALVEPKTDERSAAARFLHQSEPCAPAATRILGNVSLKRELAPLFSPL